jgi:hypothetical protein
MFRIKQEEFNAFLQNLGSLGLPADVIEKAWNEMLTGITENRKPGRPKIHENGAAAVRAYRARRKLEKEQNVFL